MPQDAELERLKAEQDRAFERKQDAWQAQDQAWKRRQSARDTMNRAYEEKQRAYDEQQSAWERYQQVRSHNGLRIDQLNAEQEAAFENMKNAFERATAAHGSRDGLSARMYANEGHRYKAEAQNAVAERRQLVQEIRDARDRHEPTKAPFQHAKAAFDQARTDHRREKTEHERKQVDFKRAKADFDRAKGRFQERLEVLQAESKQRKDEKRTLAERAGVPHQYLDDLYISTDADGTVNIYFGGVDRPDGLGHGHYAIDGSGKVTYRRDPFDPHGAQNFEDYEERQTEQSSEPDNDLNRRRPYFDSQYYDDGEAAGLTYGGSRTFETPIHGTDAEGRDVTVSFGRTGTAYEDQTLIADGHLSSDEFYGTKNEKGHDHSHPSDPRHDGYTDRGKHND